MFLKQNLKTKVLPYVSVDGHFVLPLELRPHGTEIGAGAHGGGDVVHDVNVDVVQNDTVLVRVQRCRLACDVVHDVSKDYARLRG